MTESTDSPQMSLVSSNEIIVNKMYRVWFWEFQGEIPSKKSPHDFSRRNIIRKVQFGCSPGPHRLSPRKISEESHRLILEVVLKTPEPV